MASTTSVPLRLGVLGAANIARQFIAGIAPSTRVKAVAVASRDLAKAESFARETGVARTYGSYEALLADPRIDAVYVPLPNGFHAEWAIKAAEAGKHVLCEKPLALGGVEAEAMFAAARRHGVHLVEAYPYLAQPQMMRLGELLRAGAIGRPRLIQASFGFTLPAGPNVRLDPAIGGGAILDGGSYPVSLVRRIAGARPVRALARSVWHESGVDFSSAAMLEFADGLVAQIGASFASGYHRHALIAGDGGVIETSFMNHPPIGGPASLMVKATTTLNAPYEAIACEGGNGFLFEAESFQRLLAEGEAHWTGATAQESIDIAFTLEAMQASARAGGTWIDIPQA